VPVSDRFVDVGVKLHVREWPGSKTPFVLLHGLSSNCRTWDAVADQLWRAGHHIVAIDQRGHGLSDKPEGDYDFATITADLASLLHVMGLVHPVLVGQSWGGNVLLEFAARYPHLVCGLAFIDGGFIDLRSRPDATWEKIAIDLKPPQLAGTAREDLKKRIQRSHPDWTEAGIEATLNNFETLSDGTIQPWLTLSRHMRILRAMWNQEPSGLYPRISAPTLICAAASQADPEWTNNKIKQVTNARAALPNCKVSWFDNTDHDIHVHKPVALAELLLETIQNGFWHSCIEQ
jgi:pimeloyl-ACP methyl ester carboxylesterase